MGYKDHFRRVLGHDSTNGMGNLIVLAVGQTEQMASAELVQTTGARGNYLNVRKVVNVLF